jgi:MoaA/NifB/PqqE/SkfB family radical SAM enzyme
VQRIFLGFACNNACEVCAQGSLRDREDDRQDAVQREVERAHGVVAFVGGEPTLHPRLFEWRAAARAAGATRIVVQTNGRRLAYRSWTVGLRGAGADAVEVSLYGSTAAMHEYHTNVPESFSQTLTGLGVARATGLDVSVTTVVTRSNYRHLVDLVLLVAARGVRRLQLSPLVRAGRAARAWSRLAPSPALVTPFVAAAVQVGRTLGVDVTTGPVDDLDAAFAGIGEIERPVETGPLARVSLPMTR